MVQGVIGSYLWRTFENTKQRPLRVISRVVSSNPKRSATEVTEEHSSNLTSPEVKT
jgi:hypothetical protein